MANRFNQYKVLENIADYCLNYLHYDVHKLSEGGIEGWFKQVLGSRFKDLVGFNEI